MHINAANHSVKATGAPRVELTMSFDEGFSESALERTYSLPGRPEQLRPRPRKNIRAVYDQEHCMLPSIPDLATIYAHELHVLSELLGVKATIINTGGGCTAIEVAVADAPGSEPVTMEITTADGGLAATGEDIVHWYAVIRTVESGVAQADGHNLYSFEAAYLSALENLRNRVVPSEGRCPCMLVPGHDYVLFNEDHLRQARTSCRSMLSAPADSVDADAVDGAPPGENLTLDCRGMIVHRSELGTIQFVRRSPTQIMAYDADTNQRIALWDGEELTGPIIATALADVVLDRVSVR